MVVSCARKYIWIVDEWCWQWTWDEFRRNKYIFTLKIQRITLCSSCMNLTWKSYLFIVLSSSLSELWLWPLHLYLCTLNIMLFPSLSPDTNWKFSLNLPMLIVKYINPSIPTTTPLGHTPYNHNHISEPCPPKNVKFYLRKKICKQCLVYNSLYSHLLNFITFRIYNLLLASYVMIVILCGATETFPKKHFCSISLLSNCHYTHYETRRYTSS